MFLIPLSISSVHLFDSLLLHERDDSWVASDLLELFHDLNIVYFSLPLLCHMIVEHVFDDGGVAFMGNCLQDVGSIIHRLMIEVLCENVGIVEVLEGLTVLVVTARVNQCPDLIIVTGVVRQRSLIGVVPRIIQLAKGWGEEAVVRWTKEARCRYNWS